MNTCDTRNLVTIDSKLLYGAWHLEKFEQLDSNGQTLKSHRNSKGLLVYLSTGEISVSMSREVDSDDVDIQRNFVRHLYYAGTFTVDGDTINHQVDIALQDPHRNQSLPRRARFENDNKRLVLEALSPEGRVLSTIFWTRN